MAIQAPLAPAATCGRRKWSRHHRCRFLAVPGAMEPLRVYLLPSLRQDRQNRSMRSLHSKRHLWIRRLQLGHHNLGQRRNLQRL